MTLDAVTRMTVGQVIDFAIERYNTEHQGEGKDGKPKKRKATQADWDAFLG